MTRNHLDTERISALLDEPWADLEAEGHMEACEACRSEYERLSRMRMAISGLGELDPPAGQWSRIEERLATSPFVTPIDSGRRRAMRILTAWPVQAAAAFALFAGGVMAGLQITASPDRTDVVAAAPAAATNPATTPAVFETPERQYADRLAELNEMGGFQAVDLRQADGTLDASEAARRLARLDAMIQASQIAIERSPGDAVANAMLFRLVEQRGLLADQLHDGAHLANAQEW